ncbi:hypothetical protein INT43_002437 [Umbelopsis isabellina]|uniref:BTB domain-containing protein n=1 Tax=Mortierella isabellina TaxID=91625 RepID=A0A8H7Q3V2_MORIS|nr:hypothetical protein INT43_002437 [Umbelopsis isabellina]
MLHTSRKRARTNGEEEVTIVPLSKPYRASELIKRLGQGDDRSIQHAKDQLAQSTDQELWAFFRRILRNFEVQVDDKSAIPPAKVLECIHFLLVSLCNRPQGSGVGAALVPSNTSETTTLRVCIRRIVEHIKAPSNSCQVFALKALCAALQDQKSGDWKHPIPLSLVVDEFRKRGGIDKTLEALAQDLQMVQHYALRVLTSQSTAFGKEMVEKDALWVASARVGALQDLLKGDLQLPERQREKSWSGKLNICMLAGSLVRRLVQVAETTNVRKLKEFGSSVAFSNILKVWPMIIWQVTTKNQIQGLDKLMAGFSSIVSKIIGVSQEGMDRIRGDIGFAESYHYVLLKFASLLQNEPDRLYAVQQVPEKRSTSPDQSTDIIALQETVNAVSRIIVSIYDSQSSIRLPNTIVDRVIIDTLNFLVVALWQPILPEDFDCLAQNERIPGDAIITLEENMRPSFGMFVKRYPNVIKTMLDILFRYLQLCYKSQMKELCIPAALCLRHISVVVTMEPSDAYTSVLARAQRLAALLLYYPEGIRYLSQNISPTVNNLFWHPIIENASNALRTILETDDDHVADVSVRGKDLEKGKRALQTLLKASSMSESRPKIVEADVLTLVDRFYPPRSNPIDKKDGQMLCWYMADLLYHLAKDMALVRGKLRQEHTAIPCILQILCHTLRRSQAEVVASPALERLQRSCLQVVTAFRFDRDGLQDWVRYPVNGEILQHIDQYSEATISNRTELSITPVIFKMLFPILPDESSSIHYRTEPTPLSQLSPQSQTTILTAVSALEPLFLLPTALRQIMVYPNSIRWLSQLLLAGRAYNLGDNVDEESASSLSHRAVNQVMEIDSVACLSDNQSDDDDEQKSTEVITTIDQDRTTEHWTQVLQQCLGRAIASKDSLQWFVIQDLYTDLFGPLVLSGNIRSEPMYSLISGFRNKARIATLSDLIRLFNYAKYNDEAIRLLEFTSVAICYGIPPDPERVSLLGLSETDHLNASTVFGVICRMLFCDLEPADQSLESANEYDQETFQRRTAAGQAIQILMLDMPTWQEQVMEEFSTIAQPAIPLVEPELNDTVLLATEDSGTPFEASRSLLSAASPILRALLSGQFQEATQEEILIKDVKGADLISLLEAIKRSQTADAAIVSPQLDWNVVVGLLLISDRYVVDGVTRACQKWMLQRFTDPTPSDSTLNGSMLTYRMCRDKALVMPDPSWPHRLVAHAAFKTILTHMVRVTQTSEFSAMVEGIGGQDDAEELDSFCSAMALSLHS